MANYSKWEEYLNAKHDSFEIEFKEIEKIIGKLPPSAYEYKEWWSNHPSHPLMKVSLKNGWRQTNLDLYLKKVGFHQSKNKQQVVIKKNQSTPKFKPAPIDFQKKELSNVNTHIHSNAVKLAERYLSKKHQGVQNWEFDHVCEIIPKLGSDSNVLEFLPQSRYENKKNLRLNKYGIGPFCKFSINKKYSGKSGVYIISVNDTIQYVGRCADFYKRFGMGYGNISPKNCFKGGQETNCRINHNILTSFKSNRTIQLYFLETPKFIQVEDELIEKLGPPWNL